MLGGPWLGNCLGNAGTLRHEGNHSNRSARMLKIFGAEHNPNGRHVSRYIRRIAPIHTQEMPVGWIQREQPEGTFDI